MKLKRVLFSALIFAFANMAFSSVVMADKNETKENAIKENVTKENVTKENEAEKKQRWLKNQTTTLNFDPEPPKNEVIKEGNYSPATPKSIYSDHKIYRVTLHSKVFPLPMQKIHSWVVHIETADGKPLENASVFIHGGMPEHRHGFPVKPRVKKYLGNGDYLISGVKFSMVGGWEMRINIKEKHRRDRAVFWFSVN